jgi:uncharacterized RDD family membrane protein YckC
MTTDASAVPVVENLLGRRVVAGLIDMVALIVLYFVFVALFGDSSSSGSSFEVSLNGLPALIFFVFSLAYYFGLEAKYAQTPGKMIMGLKVVALQGQYSLGKVLIRNVLRLVDALPFMYLVGIICAAVTPKHQRIGDLAAGTIIVRA